MCEPDPRHIALSELVAPGHRDEPCLIGGAGAKPGYARIPSIALGDRRHETERFRQGRTGATSGDPQFGQHGTRSGLASATWT